MCNALQAPLKCPMYTTKLFKLIEGGVGDILHDTTQYIPCFYHFTSDDFLILYMNY